MYSLDVLVLVCKFTREQRGVARAHAATSRCGGAAIFPSCCLGVQLISAFPVKFKR